MTDPLVAQLVEARKAAGLSQRAVAAAAGFWQSTISDWENGAELHVSSLQRWAQALGLQPVLVPLAYETAVSGDRADVAHDAEDKGLAVWCSCGQWSMLHFNSFGLDAYEAHAQHVAKARTLDVAEATVALARGES